MRKKHRVVLSSEQRRELARLISTGEAPARRLAHARILLKADASPDGPAWTDSLIARVLDVSASTSERVRQRFAIEGLDAALGRRAESATDRQLARAVSARATRLAALAASPPPAGHVRWTLRLLAQRYSELIPGESVSYETVRRVLSQLSGRRRHR
jgi:hypothetical protein